MIRTFILCDKCTQTISSSNFLRHREKCNGKINYWSIRRAGQLTINNSVDCKFCLKILKNVNSRRNHERLCKQNPDKQSTTFQTDRDKIKKSKLNYSNQFTKARFLGLPVPTVSSETRSKQSKNQKDKYQDPVYRQRISEKVSETVSKKLIEGNWHTYINVKKVQYNGVKFDSSWEVKYAQWLDANNISWERCNKRFLYIFENVKRYYIPDFYLPTTNEYIEIKGYKIEKDCAKWAQFPSDCKLTVLREDDLKKIGIL